MPEIEYVTVANHAEAINGLLYLQGAGWTDIQQPMGPNGQPGIVHIGLAVSILVGWNETNQRYPVSVRILHEDGSELVNLAAEVEAGRPPGLPAGSDIRSVMAISAELQFARPGGYELRAELAGKSKSAVFRVHHPAQAPQNFGPTGFNLPPQA